jgi:hypothetical protein
LSACIKHSDISDAGIPRHVGRYGYAPFIGGEDDGFEGDDQVEEVGLAAVGPEGQAVSGVGLKAVSGNGV